MENRFTAEQIEKARACKTAEELVVFAKESGSELTEAEATSLFAKLHPENGQLADSELDTVAGGSCSGEDCPAGGEHDWYYTGENDGFTKIHKCSKCGETRLVYMSGAR